MARDVIFIDMLTLTCELGGSQGFENLIEALGQKITRLHPRDLFEDFQHYWKDHGTADNKLSTFIEESALSRGRQLLICFDGLDVLHPHSDLFDRLSALLRNWASNTVTGVPGWKALRLLVVASTHPTVLGTVDHGSPFGNMVVPVEVFELEPEQVHDLARQYTALPDVEKSLGELGELVGGHPYLLRAALYDAMRGDCSLDDLVVGRHQGPVIRRFLARLCYRLKGSELGPLASRVIAGTYNAGDRALLSKGERRGLFRYDTTRQSWSTRYRLFERVLNSPQSSPSVSCYTDEQKTALVGFLLHRFSANELLSELPKLVNEQHLAKELLVPSSPASRANQCTDILLSRGFVDEGFFERLEECRPRCVEHISALRSVFGISRRLK